MHSACSEWDACDVIKCKGIGMICHLQLWTCVLGRAEIAQIKKFTQIEANVENNCLLLIQFGMVDDETFWNGNG